MTYLLSFLVILAFCCSLLSYQLHSVQSFSALTATYSQYLHIATSLQSLSANSNALLHHRLHSSSVSTHLEQAIRQENAYLSDHFVATFA